MADDENITADPLNIIIISAGSNMTKTSSQKDKDRSYKERGVGVRIATFPFTKEERLTPMAL